MVVVMRELVGLMEEEGDCLGSGLLLISDLRGVHFVSIRYSQI